MNSLRSMSFRVSAATLRASPFRTFLSTLGIVIGVASLVAVLSLGDGMQQFVRRSAQIRRRAMWVPSLTVHAETVEDVPRLRTGVER
jgi:putative ABC transport system permease protein